MTQATPWCHDREKCPCCEHRAMTHVFSSNDRFFNRNKIYDFLECPSCRCLILFPQNGNWNPEEAYPDNYPAYATEPLRWYHRVFSWYCFPKLPQKNPMPIWEIGAGTGLYWEYLSRKYAEVFGIEMDAHAVQSAEKLGRRLRVGAWESFDPGEGSVGALVMNQVIEHLTAKPDEVFAKSYRILKPGGFWCFRTPNADSWGRRRFNEFWHPLETPRHTVIYSPGAVKALAGRTGFEFYSIRYTGRAYDLTQSAYYLSRDGKHRMILLNKGIPLDFCARLAAIWFNLRRQGDSLEILLRKPGKLS